MFTQFDSDCYLINLFFQNCLDPCQRRCIRRITSWEKVYFIEFYWGRSTFISKKSDLLGKGSQSLTSGLIREFCDPLILKETPVKQRKKINHKASPRWTKKHHEQWVESCELQVRHYWGYKQYSQTEKSEDLIDAMATFAVLNIPPFTATSEVKKAFRRLALRFHPDQGGNEDNFKFLKEIYQKALVYANDYLTVSSGEFF